MSIPLGTLLAVALIASLGAPARALTLVDDGKAVASIIVAAQPDEKARLAAEELQAYLLRISGVELPMATDAAPPTGPLVLVGRSALTDAMDIDIPAGLTNSRREDGFLIHCEGDRLVLAGNDAGPYHGTEYAVYELLKRLGARWFMPGEYGEYVPESATISVPQIDLRETPDFIMRNWWVHAKPELVEPERRWKIRNKMTPDVLFAIPGDSSVRNVLPSDEDFSAHPEYFALNQDGTRNRHHPNLTNPRTIEIAAERISEQLRQDPDAHSYGFAPDDGLPRDFSPDTLELSQGFFDAAAVHGDVP